MLMLLITILDIVILTILQLVIILIMIIIIVGYILLVTPAELLNFFRESVAKSNSTGAVFNLVLAIANTCQAINFAFNFIMYCCVNTQFRKSVRDLFCCRRKPQNKMSMSAYYDSTGATAATSV